MTTQQKLNAKIARQTTERLIEMARALMNDTREGTEIVMSTILDVLMVRLDDTKFCALCAELEG